MQSKEPPRLFSGPIGTMMMRLAPECAQSAQTIAVAPVVRHDLLHKAYSLYIDSGADILLLATLCANTYTDVWPTDAEADHANQTAIVEAQRALAFSTRNPELCAMLTPPAVTNARNLQSLRRQVRFLIDRGVNSFMIESVCSTDGAMYASDVLLDSCASQGVSAQWHISFYTPDGETLPDGNLMCDAGTRLAAWEPDSIGVNCVFPPSLAEKAVRALSGQPCLLTLRPAASSPGHEVVDADSYVRILAPLIAEVPLYGVGTCCGADEIYTEKLRNLISDADS